MSDPTIEVEEHYRDVVLEIVFDDPSINKVAITLAYYMAMMDAAICDPMDDPTDQEEVLTRYFKIIDELTEKFQSLVNEKL